ncbi:MAG TPA: hypothetical protein VFV63_21565 [Ilumatobacteraceae bacterium]|nr:hypothetical protein [Ilumatobacteraceae bacterium]
MRVLMLESHPGVANAAVTQLTEAGCTIVRCDTPDRRYPCRGLAAGGECPLDEHVDVAVLVQEIGTNHVEHGAVCAARSRVPVVEVDGADVTKRFAIRSWTAVAGSDLLDACEQAAHDGRAHAEAVEDRLCLLGVVTRDELARPGGAVAIDVTRGANRLQMTIELADSVRDREAEIVRAAGQSLRDFDRRPTVIDIAVRSA